MVAVKTSYPPIKKLRKRSLKSIYYILLENIVARKIRIEKKRIIPQEEEYGSITMWAPYKIGKTNENDLLLKTRLED